MVLAATTTMEARSEVGGRGIEGGGVEDGWRDKETTMVEERGGRRKIIRKTKGKRRRLNHNIY